ncbi:MAG: hypothetical protein ACLTS6_09300 [Anaerobutyricum sp.]
MRVRRKKSMTLTGWIPTPGILRHFRAGNHEYDRLTGITDEESFLIPGFLKGVSEEEKGKIKTGYPQKAWNGGVVRELRPSVLMLERGYVFNIDGCKCFAFGGARSHDISGGILQPADFNTKKDAENETIRWQYQGRAYRVNHISWWEQEMPEQMEIDAAGQCLKMKNIKWIYLQPRMPVSDKAMIVGDGSPDAPVEFLS